MGVWLLATRARAARSLPALAVIALVGLALLPLISAQGARGTQWIGEWALKERIEDIADYYLTGYSGGRLGHSIEALVGLPLFAVTVLGGWRMWTGRAQPGAESSSASGEEDPLARRRRAVWVTLAVSAAGVLIPLVMALGGADYLAPRNLVGAMVPFSALIAVLATWPARRDALGPTLLTVALLALLAVTLTVTFDPKYQRGNWKGVVHDLPAGDERVMVVNSSARRRCATTRPG